MLITKLNETTSKYGSGFIQESRDARNHMIHFCFPYSLSNHICIVRPGHFYGLGFPVCMGHKLDVHYVWILKKLSTIIPISKGNSIFHSFGKSATYKKIFHFWIVEDQSKYQSQICKNLLFDGSIVFDKMKVHHSLSSIRHHIDEVKQGHEWHFYLASFNKCAGESNVVLCLVQACHGYKQSMFKVFLCEFSDLHLNLLVEPSSTYVLHRE
ncbi:hypothetical protein ACH5RR_003592 [Cinchona calisaya]|uniref:Uncharacterized protein n=1 Tax=Cinchona calisaya TaxID=153742 RepID=A0ABD3AVL2_9GENT